jgi:hypothetical protein
MCAPLFQQHVTDSDFNDYMEELVTNCRSGRILIGSKRELELFLHARIANLEANGNTTWLTFYLKWITDIVMSECHDIYWGRGSSGSTSSRG